MLRVAMSLANRLKDSTLLKNYLSLNSLLLASLRRTMSCGRLSSSGSESRVMRRWLSLARNCYSPLESICARLSTNMLERK